MKKNHFKIIISLVLAFVTTLFLTVFIGPSIHPIISTGIHIFLFIVFYYVYNIIIKRTVWKEYHPCFLSLSLAVFIISSLWAMHNLPEIYYPRQLITLSPSYHEGSLLDGNVYLVAVQVDGKDVPIYGLDAEYDRDSGWIYVEEYDDYKLPESNLHKKSDTLTLSFKSTDDIVLVFSRSAYGGDFLIQTGNEVSEISSFTTEEELVGAMYVDVEKGLFLQLMNIICYLILTLIFWLILFALFIVIKNSKTDLYSSDHIININKKTKLDIPWLFSCSIFSLLISFSMILGRENPLYPKDFVFPTKLDWFIMAIITLSSIGSLYFGFPYFFTYFPVNKNHKTETEAKSNKTKRVIFYVLLFSIIVLSWLPIFLCTYPGLVTSDSIDIIHQARGDRSINNWHPVLYTLYIRFFFYLSSCLGISFDVALGLASLVQLIALAAVCSGSVFFLERNGARKIWLIVLFLYYSFCPIFALHSVIFWKDIFFGIAMTAFVIQCFSLVQQKDHEISLWPVILFCITGCWISFARNNGIYVFIITSFLIIFFMWKQINHYLVCFLVSIAAVLIIQGPVYKLLNIAPSPFTESVAIPLQQIGYTAVHEKLSEEEKTQIERFIPIDILRSEYRLYTSDSIKFHSMFNGGYISEHKDEFFKLWFSLLQKYPLDYLKAHLGITDGYWNLHYDNGPALPVSFSYYTFEQVPYRSVDLVEQICGFSLYKSLFIDGVFTDFLNNTPPMSSLMILLFLTCLVSIYKKNYKQIIVISPLILLWGTIIIAAPHAYSHRYLFAVYIAAPMLFILQISLPTLQKSIPSYEVNVQNL